MGDDLGKDHVQFDKSKRIEVASVAIFLAVPSDM
jgi:hypothetical protein